MNAEPCAICHEVGPCEHDRALHTDLHAVAPHHPGPPEPPHPTPTGTPRAERLVYQRPEEPMDRPRYIGASLARHIHARGPHCSACVEGWPVRCECGGHVHCGPAPQRPICERSPGGGCDQARPVRDDAS